MAAFAQEPATKPENSSPASEKPAPAKGENRSTSGEKAAAKVEEKTALPFQIELLETRVRFEANGDSRKEVHTVVKINEPAGARQFSRLGFDYNRAFQGVEIPFVKITHANGGTSEILPSAITDAPNPAVEKFPAYQDVRVKSVRILGLQEGDSLEYRVITTTTKPPLAPDFWLEHTFDRSGQVLQEGYEIDLPASKRFEVKVNSATPADSTREPGEGGYGRVVYHWTRTNKEGPTQPSPSLDADIMLTSYESWLHLSHQMSKVVEPSSDPDDRVQSKALELTKTLRTDKAKLEGLCGFVTKGLRSVDLPLGATGFRTRSPGEILETGYGIAEDKFALLASLAWSLGWESHIALFGREENLSIQAPRPSLFVNSAVLIHIPAPAHKNADGTYTVCDHCGEDFWFAPAMEVAPFGAMPASLRGRQAFVVNYMFDIRPFVISPKELPFPSRQSVNVEGSISSEGTLHASVRYIMRGDNELVLREAFHQTAKEGWNEVAGLLALADGFRGEITKVTASDPMETKEPFTVEYEITQPKFVDWTKKPVRIPALLPQIALPDAPGKSAEGKIELGTPLEVEARLTLRLPEGTTVQTPPGTSVERDYATYASKYDGHLNTLTASRHVHFLMREMPGERAADYNAFVRAVQTDQAQVITLFPNSEKK